MAKFIALALALAFAALVAIASAHNTIITATIEDENPISRQQCSQQIQGERFNQCEKYLQEGQSWYEKIIPGVMQGGDLQSCCEELQNVDQQCQCEAVKQAFRQAQRKQQQQQGGSFGSQQIKQMKQKAENLPNQCQLQTRQCQVGAISITTTFAEQNPQMCQNIRGRRFNQCQSYIWQQQSGTPLLMSVGRKGEWSQGLQQCCSELKMVEAECQCEAMQEVYRQAAQQMQMQRQQQGGRQMQELKQIVENLRNQCDLQVQQCRIPSAMF